MMGAGNSSPEYKNIDKPEKKATADKSEILTSDSFIALRAMICLAVLMFMFVGLGVRLVKLQYFQHEQAIENAQHRMSGKRKLEAERASILDSKGRELAVSLRGWGCAIDPATTENFKATVYSLRGALSLSTDEILKIIKYGNRKGCRFVWVKRNITKAETATVKALRLDGVVVVPSWKRNYPQNESACHLIGFTDIDGRGLEGIEKKMDNYLLSKPGSIGAFRDARRRVFRLDPQRLVMPQKGNDVVLTLDLYIQSIAEKALHKVCDKYKPERASAIVMDPFTGDILAMANMPYYNLNKARNTAPELRINSAVATVYEPGSVFKPFVLASALERGAVSLQTPVFCENGAWNLKYRVLHDSHGYGTLSAAMVVVKSSNIGIAKIAKKIGMKHFYAYLKDFGFGAETGSGFTGELPGILHPLREWNPLFSMTSVPMGHEVCVTSLQLVNAYSALVNGGLIVRPRIVKALKGEGGKVFPVEPLRRVISGKTSAMIRNVMGDVVKKGTGRRAKSSLYKIGGKTGTAQVAGVGGYEDKKYIANFCGFAPVDAPRLVVLVSVVDPKGAYYGGKVSAPAVKEIIENALLYMKVPAFNRAGSLAMGRE